MNTIYEKWLKEHLKEAKAHYVEVCRLDDEEFDKQAGNSQYFEKAHQMFGYIAALEKCLRETQSLAPTPDKVLINAKAKAKVLPKAPPRNVKKRVRKPAAR